LVVAYFFWATRYTHGGPKKQATNKLSKNVLNGIKVSANKIRFLR